MRPSRFAIRALAPLRDRKSTRLNSSHLVISYAVFCLKKKKNKNLSSKSDIQASVLHSPCNLICGRTHETSDQPALDPVAARTVDYKPPRTERVHRAPKRS